MKIKKPEWITIEAVKAIHRLQLDKFGGPVGIRDEGLLESALNRPQNLFHYEKQTTVFRLAAGYGFGIAKNHPFVDGNKRTAFLAMFVFLGNNGWSLEAPQVETILKMLALAAGELNEDDLAQWLQSRSVRSSAPIIQ